MTQFIRTRTGAVLGGAAVLALFTGGGAVAHGLITGDDIVNQSIEKRDIGPASVGTGEVVNGSLGMRDLDEETRSQIGHAGAAVRYVERTITATRSKYTWLPAFCPANTQVITGYRLRDHNLTRSDGVYVDPAENAWVVKGRPSVPAEGEGRMRVRLVCLA